LFSFFLSFFRNLASFYRGRHNPGGAQAILREYRHVNAESLSTLWNLNELDDSIASHLSKSPEAAKVAEAAAAAAAAKAEEAEGVFDEGYWKAFLMLLKSADLKDFGRGLGLAADHINILGNNGLIEDVLRIATGTESSDSDDNNDGGNGGGGSGGGAAGAAPASSPKAAALESRVISSILEVTARIQGDD
jgi:hypothetical protein